MAETFRARVERAGGGTTQVAIQKALPSFVDDGTFAPELIREAKLSERLSHPNVLQIFEVGQADGQYFMAMEWLEGRSVGQLLDRTAGLGTASLPASIACFVAIEVLKGLHYFHTVAGADGAPLRIVHGDLSPAKVLVGFEGQAKVVDFGRAKTAFESNQGLAYLSPEQLRATPLDARSDVFSLGAVLYQMLTGAPPYAGSPEDVLRAGLEARFNPVEQLNPLVPDALAAMVARSMAKDPGNRYGSALEMQQELTQFLHRDDPTFSSVTVKDWMSSLFPGQTAEPAARPIAAPVVTVAPVSPPKAEQVTVPPRSGVGIAVAVGMLALGGLTLLALRPEPVATAPERSPAPARSPIPPAAKAAAAEPIDAFVYPATVVVRAQRHRLRFEGLALPTVTFAPNTRPQLVERAASDEDSPLFLKARSTDPARDGQISLVLQRPAAFPDVSGGQLFDFHPFETPLRGATRTFGVGDPATPLAFADQASVIDARAANWITVDNVPPAQKVRLTLRAIDPQAWAGRPRGPSVLVVWKRAFGRLLPPPGGDWPDELDRAVLTADKPLVVEHATALAFAFADGLAAAEKDSVLVEIFGTGEPASRPDPAALARAAKEYLGKMPPAPTSQRRPIPKTIDLSGPGAEVLFDEGLTFFQEGRLAQARVKLDRCVAIAPSDFECHKLLGAILDRLGDFKNAARAYQEYLRLAPAGDPDLPKVRALLELHGVKQ